jgi:hypothetical protein
MTQTPEQWARAKKLFFAPALIYPAQKGQRPQLVDVCAILAGAMVHNKWVANDQLTEEQFDKGLADFNAAVIQ